MNRIILNETSYYGAGCRTAIADEIKKRGFSKVLLVTDKDLIKFGVAAKIEEVLKNADIPYEIYSEIKPNPTIKNVLDGLAAFKASGADCMVALGGGSSIDTAKAIGIINNNPETVSTDFDTAAQLPCLKISAQRLPSKVNLVVL